MKTALFAAFLLLSVSGWCQRFPQRGQLATTAFPVCGTDTFQQVKVPYGATHNFNLVGCGLYPDTNPFWYTFTCYSAGTLGFLISPNNYNDDYDWELFDVTGHSPLDVFIDSNLQVTGNWSGTGGYTGAKVGGANYTQCGSDPRYPTPTFSSMPNLILGHTYLLLISHYTDTQSGYSLVFTGGTALINNPLLPSLKSIVAGCNKQVVTVVLTYPVRCSSLAADGSDFKLANYPDFITAATGLSCDTQFDMDSISLTFNKPLPPGTYKLLVQKGTDGNTLTDDCGNQMLIGDSINIVIDPPKPTPMDSLTTPECATNMLQLVFADPMQCSSIAADGSDFSVSGPSTVIVSGAAGICVDGVSNLVQVQLASPITVGGNYQIKLKTGSDRNTIINACGDSTLAGSTLSFTMQDTVSADFDYVNTAGCLIDTIQTIYFPSHGVNSSIWNVDSDFISNQMSPAIYETVFGLKNVQHIVSNGFCSDTVSKIINLDNLLIPDFLSPAEVCPKDLILFTDSSIGHIESWVWDFGDGTSSNMENPPAHLFPDTQRGITYKVSLTVNNDLGCMKTVIHSINKLQSCYITVPNAFTPNGDGINDYLYPLNAFSASNLEFMVFNRYGQRVFETRDWSHKWDGTIGGTPQATGTYVWRLRYTDGNTGQTFFLRGTTVLIR